MERISSASLRAYVVWLPVLRAGDVESAAHREAGRVWDARAAHFYDAEARLGKLYSSVIHLPSGMPAWDVYLVFAPSVRWDGTPPAPTYWMHQLGRAGPSELRLNGKQLARVVSGLLRAPERKPARQNTFGAD